MTMARASMLLSLLGVCVCRAADIADDDGNKTPREIAHENGWAFESYNVTTQDGYILELWRIPGRTGEAVGGKPATLLMHGLVSNGVAWMMNEPALAPAFTLAAAGHDVWIGNNRGCRYGRAHTTLSPEAKAFWEFDQEEMGMYDVPAFVDFMKGATGAAKVGFVGYSEGNTQMFMALGLAPAYFAANINLFIALAPIANMGHAMSPLVRMLAKMVNPATKAAEALGLYEFVPYSELADGLTSKFCGMLPKFCLSFLALATDLNPMVDNSARVGSFTGQIPSGTGFRNIAHYGQIVKDKRFQRYDFGAAGNVARYNQTTPPEYVLAGVPTMPIGIFSGSIDELGNPTDTAALVKDLGRNVVFSREYYVGHIGLGGIAKNMSYFTDDAIALLKKYETRP
eukprot:TRINITY_DN24698_c0_g1_i1.p1 TRINITY_DN24698_c0_g1~~TRINITY_DN24698_c0_g1_i1.p1  ORF type:complete len:398 (+),score=169.02 TRINITY_DN24698_c0_g1_i1:64-1257(+)